MEIFEHPHQIRETQKYTIDIDTDLPHPIKHRNYNINTLESNN